MLQEFRRCFARNNVLALAVAVIVGAAFATITASSTEDTIVLVVGGLDFSAYLVRLRPVPAGYAGALTDYGELRMAATALLGDGQFLTDVLNFVTLAFAILLLVRAVSKAVLRLVKARTAAAEEAPLREIRDALRS